MPELQRAGPSAPLDEYNTTFLVLMNTFSFNEKVIERVLNQIPITIHTMEMLAFDQMIQTGTIIITWNDVLAYAWGDITGNQLGSRIFRTTASP